MSLLAEQTTVIACPAEVAYRFACDLERFGTWFPGVIAIAAANDLPPLAVGKQYRETVAIPLRGTRKVTITVTEVALNQRFVTEGTLAPLLPQMEIDVRATGPGSCEVSWRMRSRSASRLVRWLLVPLARRVMQQRAAVGLAALKHTLERGGPPHDGQSQAGVDA
ncbi:MAG TPA: SRPBCC family protein [Herpetosiphonaceae bacterium]